MSCVILSVVIGVVVYIFTSKKQDDDKLGTPQWGYVEAAKDGKFIIEKVNTMNNGESYTIPNGVWQLPSTLTINGKSNITIQGSGNTILYGPGIDTQNVLIDTCQNISLKNMTLMRGAIPPFFQTIVRSVVTDNTLIVQVLKGYRSDLENTPTGNQPGIVFTSEQTIKPESPDVFLTSVIKEGQDQFKIICSGPTNAIVGDFIVFRCAIKEDIALWNSTSCVLESVTLSNCSGFAVLENGGGGGHLYDKVKIIRAFTPANATIPCLMAANADGFHSSNCKIGPTLKNCYIERVGDDCLNVHGRIAKITSILGNNVTVSISEPQGLTDTGEITLLDSKGTFIRRTKAQRNGEVLTLDSVEGLSNGCMVESNDKCGNGANVSNCKFVENRARGLFFKCWDAKCLNNTIIGATIAGIAVCPEPSWGESGYSRNVEIRGNVIKRVGYSSAVGPSQELVGAISVTSPYPEVAGKQGHENINIEGNTISETKGILIYISHVESGVVKNNTLAYQGLSTRGASFSNQNRAIVVSQNSKIQVL
jgi:hypothetical protein